MTPAARTRREQLINLLNFARAIEPLQVSVRESLERKGTDALLRILKDMEPGEERAAGVRMVLEEAALARQRQRVRVDPKGSWIRIEEAL